MTYFFDGDEMFSIAWEDCDLVVETAVVFDMWDLPEVGGNIKFFEIVIEDRICETDMVHTSSVRLMFDATLEPC